VLPAVPVAAESPGQCFQGDDVLVPELPSAPLE
jgi:hypothetical protein